MPDDRDPLLTAPRDFAPGRWFGRVVWSAAVLMIVAAVVVTYQGILDQSTERIVREHGLSLPSSASNPECRGDAWHMILDRGASSTFEMARTDLCSFVSTLRIRGSHLMIPANGQYQVSAPWIAKRPIASYECDSPTGDWLNVQIFPIDCKKVGVRLYTDWN
ncbi:hypothetical protein KBB96_11920 [Luteolibacter ambystomatis]|uniref:Uncharacterized protein n=1 Tax=Luteolibacter ambystomatis TaxID=2824561 RepID=A0A975G688_9BACT|nr:hypothetical protein [Luteolibacter ambystomatis]QUE49580.1 hypothetical protein KBB96_11920 [Luteolibacter ambystomatis]